MSKRSKRRKRQGHRERRRTTSKPHKAPSHSPAQATNPITVRSRAEFETYLADDLPVIVDFSATWCAPGRMMAPIFEAVGRQFEGQVRFLKVDTEEVPDVAAAFEIRSIPTLLVLHGSEVTDSHIGLTSEPQLSKMARRADDRAQGVTLRHRLMRLFEREGDKQTAAA